MENTNGTAPSGFGIAVDVKQYLADTEAAEDANGVRVRGYAYKTDTGDEPAVGFAASCYRLFALTSRVTAVDHSPTHLNKLKSAASAALRAYLSGFQ